MSPMRRLRAVTLIVFTVLLAVMVGDLKSALAEGGIAFEGTVLSVDTTSGKFAVKKEGGGSRFTFVANEQTHFDGGPKVVKDLKKGDHVAVLYQVQGSQYVARSVTLTK